MDKLRQWVALTLVAVLAVLAAGWFLLISPKRASAATVRAQVASTMATTDQLRTQLSVLKAQAKKLPAEQAKLDAADAKIPGEVAMPELIRTLTATALSSGVQLLSISPGTAAPVAAAVAAAPPVTSSAASDSPATPAAPRVVRPAAGGAGTLSAQPLTLTVVGSYFRTEQFLAALEDLPRALRITGLTLAPGGGVGAAGSPVSGGQLLSSTVTGQVFVATGRTPLAPVVLPGTPAPKAKTAPVPSSTATASRTY